MSLVRFCYYFSLFSINVCFLKQRNILPSQGIEPRMAPINVGYHTTSPFSKFNSQGFNLLPFICLFLQQQKTIDISKGFRPCYFCVNLKRQILILQFHDRRWKAEIPHSRRSGKILDFNLHAKKFHFLQN